MAHNLATRWRLRESPAGTRQSLPSMIFAGIHSARRIGSEPSLGLAYFASLASCVKLVDFLLKLPRHILGHTDVANREAGHGGSQPEAPSSRLWRAGLRSRRSSGFLVFASFSRSFMLPPSACSSRLGGSQTAARAGGKHCSGRSSRRSAGCSSPHSRSALSPLTLKPLSSTIRQCVTVSPMRVNVRVVMRDFIYSGLRVRQGMPPAVHRVFRWYLIHDNLHLFSRASSPVQMEAIADCNNGQALFEV